MGFSVKIDENFNDEQIIKMLKGHDDDGWWFIPNVEFVFTEYGNNIFAQLNHEFNSKEGAPAYDRRKLYLAIQYTSKFDIDHDLTKVAQLCRTDKILGEIMGGDTPCRLTFDNFLAESDTRVLKKLSVCTLMELNDLEFLDFDRLYTDSSDAKINGSVHYKVGQKEIDGLKLMKKYDLLHNRNIKQMRKKKKKLLKIQKELPKDSDEYEIIDNILKNFKLYDKRVYDKLNVLEEYLEKDPESYVCIMFPESKFHKKQKNKI